MEWRFAIQETVGQNRYIPLPGPVRDAVAKAHPLDGECVYWNYESHSKFAVLSRAPLSGESYVDVGRYKVYDTEADGDEARIRPPDALETVVRSGFLPDGRVTYLAHDGMLGDAPAVYLLPEPQLLRLLPESTDPDERVGDDPAADDIAAALLRTPGFMPA